MFDCPLDNGRWKALCIWPILRWRRHHGDGIKSSWRDLCWHIYWAIWCDYCYVWCSILCKKLWSIKIDEVTRLAEMVRHLPLIDNRCLWLMLVVENTTTSANYLPFYNINAEISMSYLFYLREKCSISTFQVNKSTHAFFRFPWRCI
jgi:hypothetical protein